MTAKPKRRDQIRLRRRHLGRRALVGDPDTIAERLQEYADIGIATVIASGYPHLEEAYRVADLLFPKLNLKHETGQDRLKFPHASPWFTAPLKAAAAS